MRTVLWRMVVGLALALALAATACGSSSAPSGRSSIVVTTSVLGDVVRNLVGDEAHVEVVMPAGTDPHDFAPSPQQVRHMREADLLVVNGGGFEAGLVDTIDSAQDDGAKVVTAIDGVHPLRGDPHFFTDPRRMATAARTIADQLAVLPGVSDSALEQRVATYLDELDALDDQVEALLAPIPADRRLLVTNHEAFGHFAERYGFTVLGAIIPSMTTGAEPTARDLADLADLVRQHHIPAVFAETSAPTKLAKALAAEVGTTVEVVELYSESLGPNGSGADTYIGMIRTDTQRIAAALR